MTKDSVLAMLRQSAGSVSGEDMSKRLGISRAAVNVAIKTLRAEGYRIDSATNRGYALLSGPDALTMGELLALLPEARMERVLCLDSVSSTNDYLKELAQKGAPSGLVVAANGQTGGRGRMGREFSSPAGKGVYMSMLIRPHSLPADTAEITAWTAVAISRAVERACGVGPDIKWINDLLLDGRKICGILTELSVEGESGTIQYVVIGVGVNANEALSDFPEEIQETAGSVRMAAGRPVCRAKLAAEMIKALDDMAKRWPDAHEEYLAEYRKKCVTPGKAVLLKAGDRQERAFAESIDDSFGLQVRLPDGTRRSVNSGEASVRVENGYV